MHDVENWSKIKRKFQIGSQRVWMLQYGTANIESSRISFGELFFQIIAQIKNIFKY